MLAFDLLRNVRHHDDIRLLLNLSTQQPTQLQSGAVITAEPEEDHTDTPRCVCITVNTAITIKNKWQQTSSSPFLLL